MRVASVETSSHVPEANCTSATSASAIAKLVENSSVWREWAVHMEHEFQQGWAQRERQQKALTMYLVGSNWMTVGEAAQEAWPVCAAEGCVHTLDLTTSKMLDDTSKGSVVDARNYIEGELALFLRRCPRGVVVVQGIHNLNHQLVPALSPAISEGGQFLYGGKVLPAHQSVFILAGHLPVSHACAHGLEEESFMKCMKSAFQTDIAEKGLHTEAAVTNARVLRRRIDFVAPLR